MENLENIFNRMTHRNVFRNFSFMYNGGKLIKIITFGPMIDGEAAVEKTLQESWNLPKTPGIVGRQSGGM